MFERIKNFFSALLFGMKAGDNLMTTSNQDPDEGSSVHQQIEKKSVLQDLINGEVTQEVEELRYETFKAEEMANEYRYIGSGVALRKDSDEEVVVRKRRKFVQYNVNEEYSILESLQMVDSGDQAKMMDWKTRKTFKMTYKNPCVRFRLENSAEKVRVELNDDENLTYLYFVDDSMNRSIRPLVNFIKKTKKDIDGMTAKSEFVKLKAYMNKNELCSELDTFSFTTISASNDVPNGIDYNFSKPSLKEIRKEEGYVILVYSWKEFDGNVLLSERFKSKTAEEKFNNKAPREGYIPNAADLYAKKPVEIRKRDSENLSAWLNEEEEENDKETKEN